MATCQTLLVDRPRTGITVATLNRPDQLNALTFGMFDDLAQLAAELENRNQALAAGTHDMVEAFTAFRQKRPPAFTGR